MLPERNPAEKYDLLPEEFEHVIRLKPWSCRNRQQGSRQSDSDMGVLGNVFLGISGRSFAGIVGRFRCLERARTARIGHCMIAADRVENKSLKRRHEAVPETNFAIN